MISKLIVAYWNDMVSYNLVNIGSGNGFLTESAKPLPEPVLIYLQRCYVAFTR